MTAERSLLTLLALVAGLGYSGPASAQEAAPDGVRVFLDCEAHPYCDRDFLRREVTGVDWMRDREDAQVHLLVSRQSTGGGGSRLTLDFLGREELEGHDTRVEFSVRANLARERVLTRLARRIELGLAGYLARLPEGERFRLARVEAEEGEETGEAPVPEEDPWNLWVFRVSTGGSFSAQERTDRIRVSGSLSADRVAEEMKVELDLRGRYAESNFELADTTTVTSISRSYGMDGLVVWSLGPHWSTGLEFEADHSTFRNREFAARVAPGLEYSLYPYEESERRQLTALYTVGPRTFNWRERTVFGETSETRLQQELELSMDVQEPWGQAGGRLTASSFLDDFSQNRLELFANVDFRLFRGLSLGLFGQAARIRDQINLPQGDATDQEILLRQQELRTGFEYSLRLQLSYTFGSIHSNVVNPRF